MNEIIEFIKHYTINQAFLATHLLITLNNIWKSIELRIPIQIIRYLLIIAGCIALIEYILYLFFQLESEENMSFFLKRANSYGRETFIFMIICYIFLPLLLFIKKLGTSKYFLLATSFLIGVGAWFESFVIIVTSIHRGHIPTTWYVGHTVFYMFIFIVLPSLLVVNLVLDLRKVIKKKR